MGSLPASARRSALAAILATACGLAGGPAGAAPRAGVAVRDSFSGTIGSATGAARGDSGTVKVTLAPGAGTGDRRTVTVILSGRVCRDRRCRALGGRLRGTLIRRPNRIPDIGQRFTLALAGSVAPLGPLSGDGTVNGTGFIARGRETLAIRLRARHGTVALLARSAVVPGFTSP